jgi:hypothetical protein
VSDVSRALYVPDVVVVPELSNLSKAPEGSDIVNEVRAF